VLIGSAGRRRPATSSRSRPRRPVDPALVGVAGGPRPELHVEEPRAADHHAPGPVDRGEGQRASRRLLGERPADVGRGLGRGCRHGGEAVGIPRARRGREQPRRVARPRGSSRTQRPSRVTGVTTDPTRSAPTALTRSLPRDRRAARPDPRAPPTRAPAPPRSPSRPSARRTRAGARCAPDTSRWWPRRRSSARTRAAVPAAMKRSTAGAPPRRSKETMAPESFGISRRASACCGCDGRPG